jgi:hypothetical protein
LDNDGNTNGNITIDGGNHTVYINGVNNFLGLFRNGSYKPGTDIPGKQNIIIKNIKVNGNNGILAEYAGWLGQAYFRNGNIYDCSSNGTINNYGGGIIGAYAASYTSSSNQSGTVNVYNCSSDGIINNNGGGIFGLNYQSGLNANTNAYNCYSTGQINGGGGIFGRFGGSGSNCISYAINCYSTGLIIGGGGIFGNTSACSGKTFAINCYSTGDMIYTAGGIYGNSTAFSSGEANAINCYSTGNIDNSSGGIYSQYVGAGAIARAIKCYSLSNSKGNNNGNNGIFADNYYNIEIKKCFVKVDGKTQFINN